ncbi:hypothetical protein B7P43_G00612 [Cryptotermes secundus]|uniref:DDE Tnp4 domain-containing protein n=1 Tax=Cryptotermes secundus TaxID=105785 RepID=A0A2J7PV25_9NEOP|nr:hypothetical protein B7P43_G00612 [Cryptotermes secundus]
MEVEEIAAIANLYYRTKRRFKRKYWVHPLLSSRSTKGMFTTFFIELRTYEEKFFSYTRMSIKSFDELLDRIRPLITGINTTMRPCISAEEKLLVTLRYLATGCTFADLHHTFRLGETTLREALRQVCHAIWTNQRATCVPEPTRDQWLKIAQQYGAVTNFPNCVGALDGKHIQVRVVKPAHSGSLFYNYKHYFSFVLIASASADYKFTLIDVGAYGKCSDSAVFNQSLFCNKLQSNKLDIPEGRPISSSDNRPIPCVFVADEGFGLTDKVMRPFSGSRLDFRKRVFNYRLYRARRIIEYTLGILANKWRIFQRPLNVDIDFAMNIVKCCCILHNFVRDRDGVEQIEEDLGSCDFNNFQNCGARQNRNGFFC